jgi:hypothetical protein
VRPRRLATAPACLFRFFAIGLIFIGEQGGCDSHLIAPGNNSNLTTLDAAGPSSTVVSPPSAGTVSSCQPGSGHPNICCFGAPGKSAVCVRDSGPFRPCDPGWFTFPETGSCCSLENLTECVETPTSSAQELDGAVTETCHYQCGPGGYLPVALDPDAGFFPPGRDDRICCTGNPPNTSCALPSSRPGSVCISGQPCPEPPPPPCRACPEGWSRPMLGQDDICCSIAPGVTACFSQAETIL